MQLQIFHLPLEQEQLELTTYRKCWKLCEFCEVKLGQVTGKSLGIQYAKLDGELTGSEACNKLQL